LKTHFFIMLNKHASVALFIPSLLAAAPLDFEPTSGWNVGDVVSQSIPDLNLTGKSGVFFVEPAIGVNGSAGLRSVPSEPRKYDRINIPMPMGDSGKGRVRFAFDIKIDQAPAERDHPAVSVTFGRDSNPPTLGRALRFAIYGSGDIKIANDASYIPNAVAINQWVRVSGIIDFTVRTSFLQFEFIDAPSSTPLSIPNLPFIKESPDPQDERGRLEIGQGGGTGARFIIDNLRLDAES
jgi:hypothetical protein